MGSHLPAGVRARVIDLRGDLSPLVNRLMAYYYHGESYPSKTEQTQLCAFLIGHFLESTICFLYNLNFVFLPIFNCCSDGECSGKEGDGRQGKSPG